MISELAGAAGDLPDAIRSGPRRLVVSSPMKCGSTYAAHILARYLGTDVPAIGYDWLSEHRVTHEVREQLHDRPFVLALHLLPGTDSLNAMVADDMRVTLQWRNLADTIVSFDDHVGRYGAHNAVFFLDHERYVRMPAQERYRHVLDRVVPWNLGFLLRWSLLELPVLAYEWMVEDAPGFFRFALWRLGIALDEERLRDALRDLPAEARFNRGVVGRSADLFDAETKRRLERHVLDHPNRDELDVLLWELPWAPLELRRVSPLDGTVVRAAGDDTAWFVSRGIRHAVTSRWMISRATRALREPAPVEGAQLARLPEGEPLR